MTDQPLYALPLTEYLDRLASGEPTPGGGSSAALAGAVASALVSMVCNLTAGREKFAEFEQEVVQIRAVAERARRRLTEAVQADADAYGAVMDAVAMPRETDDEKARRADARQRAYHDAARVPIEIAEACVEVIRLCDRAAGTTNPNLASDITVAAFLAGGALEGAIANVQINLPLLKDEAFVADLRARIASARAVRDALFDHVIERTRA